jgi:hypothetical protein
VRAQVARLVSSRAGLICERLEARPARLAGGCGANRDPQLIRSVLPRAKGADRPNARPSLTRPGETHEFGSASESGQGLKASMVSEMAGNFVGGSEPPLGSEPLLSLHGPCHTR